MSLTSFPEQLSLPTDQRQRVRPSLVPPYSLVVPPPPPPNALPFHSHDGASPAENFHRLTKHAQLRYRFCHQSLGQTKLCADVVEIFLQARRGRSMESMLSLGEYVLQRPNEMNDIRGDSAPARKLIRADLLISASILGCHSTGPENEWESRPKLR